MRANGDWYGSATGPSVEGRRRRPRVLVIDDAPLIRWSLHAELEAHGFEATEVDGVARAREALRQRYDAVVLDVALSDGDGLAFLSHIREEQPDVPVVVLTAFAEVPSAVEAMKRGAFDYLAKKDGVPALLAVLDRAVAERSRERASRHGDETTLHGARGTNGDGAANGNGIANGDGAANGNGIANGDGADAAVSLPPNGLVLDDVERALLAQALARTEGNRSRAARLLGITRNQIRYRIRKFGLDEARDSA